MPSSRASRSPTSPITAPKGSSSEALDQLLAQLPVEGEAQAKQAEIEPLIAMGEQVLAEGDAARAASIFRQIRDMAPDNPEVVGGLARALIADGQGRRGAGVARFAAGRSWPSMPRSRGPGRRSSWRRRAGRGRHRPIEARLAANPDDHEARFELANARDGGRRPRRRRRRAARDHRPRPGLERGRGARAASCNCSRRQGSRTRGRGRSGGGFRRCCSHERQAADPRADLPAGRGDPVPALAAAAAHLRAALPRRWSATRSPAAGGSA